MTMSPSLPFLLVSHPSSGSSRESAVLTTLPPQPCMSTIPATVCAPPSFVKAFSVASNSWCSHSDHHQNHL
ncbi:hypothetical protein BP00DRAFT_84516 [Aspergillus indologenus CBS 114.80]|uniref:Uncharacterized protein n=1 Tax=Aspergillus indologenus CBS 114.80 TaxID=1450541 RepID=A0A2V5IBY2_9EURO|nr:hypothetical protein BP00DRAFT_84516 [Aspergillus indologenus CBS 114.80]